MFDKPTALFLLALTQQDEQQSAHRHEEGIEHVGNDVEGRQTRQGSRRQKLRSVGNQSLKDGGENIQKGRGTG